MADKQLRKLPRWVIAGAAALGVYVGVIRPRVLRWGANDAEVGRPLPGDELISHPRMTINQAITIHAPAARIWPWLVQIGYKRAGWYSYDWIHRILTAAGSVDDERRSADRIIPELQCLQVGDSVEIGPGMGYQVAEMEPGRALVLYASIDMSTWQSFNCAEDGLPEKYLVSSWVWFLNERAETRTRLIVRIQQDYDPSLANALMMRGLIEPGSLIMQRGTLRGIKQRVEQPGGVTATLRRERER